MNGAIYAADMWCVDCAEKIKQRIRATGGAPKDEDDQTSYDSDEFPKDCDKAALDTVEHCAATASCINAIELDGFKIGCWLENDLTAEGRVYVIEAVRNGRDGADNQVTELWALYYDYLDFESDDCTKVSATVLIDTDVLTEQRALIGTLIGNLCDGRTGFCIRRDLPTLFGIQGILDTIADST